MRPVHLEIADLLFGFSKHRERPDLGKKMLGAAVVGGQSGIDEGELEEALGFAIHIKPRYGLANSPKVSVASTPNRNFF